MFADGARIGQALINLISNSLQYTPPRGKLTLSDSAAIFKSPVSPHPDTEGICIYVTDTGCGIPQDKIDAIFSPSISSKKAEHNFGLGLAIVFQTIAQSRGVIEVASEVGKGTTFMLNLPAKIYDFEKDIETALVKNWSPNPQAQQEVYDLPPGMFGNKNKKDDDFVFPEKWLPKG